MIAEVVDLKQQHVIAKLIADPEYRSEMTMILKVQDFVSEDYRKIYGAIQKLIAQNKALDPLILIEMSGVALLPKPEILEAQIDYYALAKRLASDGNQYRKKALLSEFVNTSDEKDFDFDKKFDELLKEINQPIELTTGVFNGTDTVMNFIEDSERRKNEVVGITGIKKLDDLLEGLERGHVYSFVAAPGVGKSMMGIQIMHESMKLGSGVLYLSNEMSNSEIIARFLSRETKISNLTIRRGSVDPSYEKQVFDAQNRLANLFDLTKSTIYDQAFDFDTTLQVIRHQIIKYNLKLVVVDHLHNFRGKADIFDRISFMAHGFQQVARELNVGLVLLAQISQDGQRQKDIELVTAKGAMDVQEVSNVMVALKRKRIRINMTSVAKDDDPNYMKIAVTKNRDGKTGVTGAYVMFPSMVIKQEEDGQ